MGQDPPLSRHNPLDVGIALKDDRMLPVMFREFRS
jgi:hypothetical protein